MSRSYECEELNDCGDCEDWHCTCDCHDDQHVNYFYGWVDNDTDDEWIDEHIPGPVTA